MFIAKALKWSSSIVIAIVLVTAPSSAQDQCTDDAGNDRCTAAAQARMRAVYGTPTIEALAEQGTRAVRTFFVDGYGRDVGAISFTRAASQEPRVEVLFAKPKSDGPIQSPLSATIAGSTWAELQSDSRHFDRRLVPLSARDGDSAICLHAWVATVEMVDAKGAIRRQTQSGCDEGLTLRYAYRLAKAAVEAIPACAQLDAAKTRNDVTRLERCSMLAGDRAAAAEVFDRFDALWTASPSRPDMALSLQPLFASSSELAWPGETPARGTLAASLSWVTKAGAGRFYPRRVIGNTADKVTIEGAYHPQAGQGPPPPATPMVMTWLRTGGWGFQVHRLAAKVAD